MSRQQILRYDDFTGLDQSAPESALAPGASPDCVNMDTTGGGLRTAKGCRRLPPAVAEGVISSLGAFYPRDRGESFLLAGSADGIYACACPGGALPREGSQWVRIYRAAEPLGPLDFLNYQDGERDVVLMADGRGPALCWDGEGLALPREGIPEGFAHIELAHERVWGAGAPGDPDRVYWSRAYNISSWQPDANDPDEGGGSLAVPTWDGGRIRLIKSLYNSVAVFKDNDMFIISGTYPGEYQVDRVSGGAGPAAPRTLVEYGGSAYMWCRDGLCVYDGLSVRRLPDSRACRLLRRINSEALGGACAAAHGDTLYFALPVDGSDVNNLVLEYDMARGTLMPRTGMSVSQFLTFGDALLYIDPRGRLYEYGAGDTYDGAPVEAHWRTPAVRSWGMRYITAARLAGDGRAQLSALCDTASAAGEAFLPGPPAQLSVPLGARGHSFSLDIRAGDGLPLAIYGGIEVESIIE